MISFPSETGRMSCTLMCRLPCRFGGGGGLGRARAREGPYTHMYVHTKPQATARTVPYLVLAHVADDADVGALLAEHAPLLLVLVLVLLHEHAAADHARAVVHLEG